MQSDLRDVLPTITAPTLVVHRRDTLLYPVQLGRYLASHIAGANYVELDGADNFLWAGDFRRQLERFRGREVKTMGDGFLATFEGPARAMRCALAVREAARQIGIEIRAGLHTWEVEQRGGDPSGIGVHLAQRVSTLANPGEVLVTRTVVDLVAGASIEFSDREENELRGIPGSWKLFAVMG